ncbi:TniB family NTP-binding protein [Mesorhizobium sp. M0244]|uniref:TniB family NTP-binding protein n=1 Tax=Mesorhizobium sp. M0244 TaxID=2956926 RepID=UPI0033377555
MSTDNVHLTQAAKDLLGEPDIVRVRALQARRWIFYPRAKQALDRLNLLVGHPRGTRMPSVAIYGDSGMGKTMIMEKFCDNNPSRFDPTTGVQAMPVLAIEMTGKPGERRLYAEILAALGAPQAPRADIVQMEQAALRLLKTVGVQVLVIDEVHNILAGSYREQRVVLNTLRFLMIRCSG